MVIYSEENRWSDFDWFLGKYDFSIKNMVTNFSQLDIKPF